MTIDEPRKIVRLNAEIVPNGHVVHASVEMKDRKFVRATIVPRDHVVRVSATMKDHLLVRAVAVPREMILRAVMRNK